MAIGISQLVGVYTALRGIVIILSAESKGYSIALIILWMRGMAEELYF